MLAVIPKILLLASLAASVVGGPAKMYQFKPENSNVYQDARVPALIDLTSSQYDIPSGTSWWISSYITTLKGKQYLAVSHIMTLNKGLCRSSVLDLDTLAYKSHVEYCHAVGNSSDHTAPLNANFNTYGFQALADDNISKMRAWVQTNQSFGFDVTWEATSKVVANGGSGNIPFGDSPIYATEWGVPAAKTVGDVTFNEATSAIDSRKSFTWYDRQLSYGAPRNWTWFQLNFPDTDIKVSAWYYDTGATGKRAYFATIRRDSSNTVVPFNLSIDEKKTWTSPNSKIVYPLSWKLEFENGDHLTVTSIVKDQEMYGPDELVDTAYEGFITVSGKFLGQKTGFGLVEIVSIY